MIRAYKLNAGNQCVHFIYSVVLANAWKVMIAVVGNVFLQVQLVANAELMRYVKICRHCYYVFGNCVLTAILTEQTLDGTPTGNC